MQKMKASRMLRLMGESGLAVLLSLISGLLQPTNLRAQGAAGAINGTVRDSSGAVIPQAAITLINVGTNATRTTVTNDTGNYALVQIPPGQYTLEVTKEGFAPGQVTN